MCFYLVLFSMFSGAGADVNAVDQSDNTALHIASEYGRTEECDMLLSEGAQTTIRNNGSKLAEDVAGNPDTKALFQQKYSMQRATVAFPITRSRIEKTYPSVKKDDDAERHLSDVHQKCGSDERVTDRPEVSASRSEAAKKGWVTRRANSAAKKEEQQKQAAAERQTQPAMRQRQAAERLERLRQAYADRQRQAAERQRQADAERQRQAAERLERLRQAYADRQRQAAERQRQADAERQRQAAERLERQRQAAAERHRQACMMQGWWVMGHQGGPGMKLVLRRRDKQLMSDRDRDKQV